MALLRSLKALGNGDFKGAFDNLWISEADLQSGENADSQLLKLNQDAYAKGIVDLEQYNASVARLAQSATTQYFEGDNSPSAGFIEGAKQGYDDVTGTIKSGLAAPFKFTWDSLPWQLIVVVLVIVAWQLGLLKKLTKS